MNATWITFMGSFVADLTFRAPRLPLWGQTVLGSGFHVGPGGKGSNQAVAAARLGAKTCFIGKVGTDAFGDLARRTWTAEGIDTAYCVTDAAHGTGAAAVMVHEERGENGIVVDPGSGMHLGIADVDRAAARIRESAVFVTQLELRLEVVEHALGIARRAGAITILNPAPALPLPDRICALCDYLTPNESEASGLLGRPVHTVEDAIAAAGELLERGVRNAIVTLGAGGAVIRNAAMVEHVPAFEAGPVVETTGAGDAFNGALAVGLAEGLDLLAATRFGCKVAGFSVTRPGTADSMPTRKALRA
jgi:ribokinase